MTVGYTVEQHEWLRAQAFQQRTTIAAVLRRCVTESRQRRGAGGISGPAVRSVADAREAGGAPQPPGPRDWIRLSLSFTPEQHAWLWRRSFDEHTTLAAVVRRYVSDARARLGSRPTADPALTLVRGPRRRPPAAASGGRLT
jgi:hypothetical protein